VIAFAGEDGRYREVSDYGARAARSSGLPLVLYDIDAAGLQAPLPTIWSADGTQEVFESGRLTPEMLEGVGRQALANAVRRYRSDGVETYAWLPGSPSLATLVHYAETQRARLIVVPEHSDHRALVDRVCGRDTSDLPDATAIAVAIVAADGVVEVA